MERSVSEQDREIREIVKRADKNPDRTGVFRRETLNRLIDLTHSRHSSLKCFAAGHIRLFFKDFPDLEEDAINAVYDLCEDQVSKVRIEGYNAIVQVSREQKKWVKRNADVLVQLLQSDERDEVGIVKKALLEHLDMDPPVTLGVLCDQILLPDEPMDEEEQHIRDRLRSLVIHFLTGEAKRTIIRHAGRPGIGAEEVLVSELVVAIPKLGNPETESIVKDLLLSLPSYSVLSQRGHDLLQVLLDKAKSCFRDDTRSGTPSLRTTRFFLDLASFLAVKKRIAPPADLLRFYCQYLGKMNLSSLPRDDQLYFIQQTAEALAASEDEYSKLSDKSSNTQLSAFREQIVTASPTIIQLLAKSELPSTESWKSCETILEACLRRKKESNWTVPSTLAISLQNITALGECQAKEENKDIVGSVQKLIRSLVSPIVKQVPPPTITALPDKANQAPNRTKEEARTNPLPHRPVAENPSSRRINIPPRVHMERDAKSAQPTPGLSIRGGAQNTSSAGPSTLLNTRNIASDDSPRSLKKARKSSGSTDYTPSLLSRLATANGSAAPSAVGIPPKRRTDNIPPVVPQTVQKPDLMDLDDFPPGGLSIRGAANRSQESSPMSRTSSSSLLDRMKSTDTTGGDKGGWKKRKRGGV